MTLPGSPDTRTPIHVGISRDLEDIVPIFLENRRKDLQTLRVAVGAQDFATLQRQNLVVKACPAGLVLWD